MHSIHFRDIHFRNLHVPKGPNLFFISVGGVVCFSLALFFFLVSWIDGGKDYEQLIGGNVALAVLIAGLILSGVLAIVFRPKK